MRDRQSFIFIFQQSGASRDNWDFSFSRDTPRVIFVPEFFHCLGCGANEIDIAATTDFIEMRILCQKAIARMDRFHVADFGRTDDLVGFKVALR